MSLKDEIHQLAALPPNWYDNYRVSKKPVDDSITLNALAVALRIADEIEGANLTSFVYPVPGGGIQFEWDGPVSFGEYNRVVEIEVLPSGELKILYEHELVDFKVIDGYKE